MTDKIARCIPVVLLIGVVGLTGCGLPAPTAAPTAAIQATPLPQIMPTVIEVTATPLASTAAPPVEPALVATHPMPVDPPTQSAGGEEAVDGWVGAVVANPAGSQFDDYFQLLDQEGRRFGIDGADDAVRQQLASYRDSGTTLRIWGTLYHDAMDAYETQIIVTRLEEYKP